MENISEGLKTIESKIILLQFELIRVDKLARNYGFSSNLSTWFGLHFPFNLLAQENLDSKIGVY